MASINEKKLSSEKQKHVFFVFGFLQMLLMGTTIFLIFTSTKELVDLINLRMIFRKTKARNIDSSEIDLSKEDYEKLEDIFSRNSSDVEKSIEFPI